MDKRIIKIEFDDSDYDDNAGIDILLKVSSTKNKKDFITISTYAYDCDDHDYWDDDATEECMNQFTEALDNENIEYDEEDFEYGSDNYELVSDKISELSDDDDDDDDDYNYFDKDEVLESIKENRCAWSTFVIDTCFDKVCQGQKSLTPGSDRIPKNMAFADDGNCKYYARIESISLIKKDEPEKMSELETDYSTNICVAFEHPNCKYIIVFALGYMNESTEDRNIRFYGTKNDIETIENSSGDDILFYKLNECTVEIKTDSDFCQNIAPLLNYYSMLLNDLSAVSEQIKVEVDLDFLRENYTLFANLIPDEDLITLPIKNNAQRIRSISVLTETYSGAVNKYDFYEANISTFSKEDVESHMQTLTENGIDLPNGRTLVLLDVIDLYDKDKFLFRKLLNDGDLKKCTIVNNIEGERTRLRRIISGIENSLSGRVVNDNLIETICKNDIQEKIPKMLKKHPYIRNEEYIDYLKKEYNILSENNEQLEAIDKIMQMNDNGVDVMLIQGPPGTGKTELILSLAKELTKKKQKTLITSNVHVACDNVVERLKNNKDIVLKRYTAIKGDQYEKELVENQKRYVENQILAGFKFEDKTISSVEVYDELCKQRDELVEKKNQIIKTKNDYDTKLEPYTFSKNRKIEIEEIESKNNKEIERLNNEILNLDTEIDEINAVINSEKTALANLEGEKKDKENLLSLNKEKLETLKKELGNLYNDNDSFEATISNNKKNIKKSELKINECNEKLQGKAKYLDFLEGTTLSEIKKSVLSYALSHKELTNYQMLLVKECLDEVAFLVEFKNKVELDKDFYQNSQDFNLSTLEYVLFTVKKSKYVSDCLRNETISCLDDIYKFYKLANAKKKAMSIFSFMKVDGGNYDYYKNCINQLNKDLKELQFNYQNIISSAVEKVITDSKLSQIADETRKEIDNLKNDIADNSVLIETNSKENDQLEAKIEFNKDSISVKTKEVFECQTSIDSITERLNSGIVTDIDEHTSIITKQNDILNDRESLKKREVSAKTKCEEDNKNLNIELSTVVKNIEKYEFNLAELIDNYESFINRYNIDLTDINRKIDKFNATFERVDSKIQSMIDNGWKKTEALEFVFNYVNELENIIESDSSNISNYFEGRGSIFTNMFLLSEDNEESLISMTTSQVASLLNSTDSDELTFDYAIVDEASKCKFEDIIISLPRVRHLVLIGDFMQLDPMYDEYKNIDLRFQQVVNSDQWEVMNKSAFSMLLSQFVDYNSKKKIDDFNGNPSVAVMKRQYRMNKGIFNVIQPIYSINKGFELIDEKKMTSNDIKCIEIKGNEIGHGTSYYNVEEGDTVVSILNMIKENKEKYPSVKSIGIITGYKAQQNYLVRKLKNFKISGVQVQIGTFDRFQGREYDLVIVSLVRTVKLGFTNNIRRMNVAFSRAKNHLLVLGDFTSLLSIARKTTKSSRDEYSSSDTKENDFVVKTLIPKLYDMKEEFVSTEEVVNSVGVFLKEADYE